jgi:hypothetical protein
VLGAIGADPDRGLMLILLGVLGLTALVMILRPTEGGEAAVRRGIWLIGGFTLLAQALFSWYMLWLLPLLALFVRPGRFAGLRADAWTGWWLFCGLVGLSYTFFVGWRPVPVALWAQFIPLYALLVWDGGQQLWMRWHRRDALDEGSAE